MPTARQTQTAHQNPQPDKGKEFVLRTPTPPIAWAWLLLLLLCAQTLQAGPRKPAPALTLTALPQRPLWERHPHLLALHLDLAIKTPPNTPTRLLFAQLYYGHQGRTTRITTLRPPSLLRHALFWSPKKQQWLPHQHALLPRDSLLVLPLPPALFPRRTTTDTVLIKLYVQQQGKRLARQVTLHPKHPPILPRLHLPLRGRWWAAAGHEPASPHRQRIRLQANGTPLLPQRFAIDFLKIDPKNRVHRGHPHVLRSYFSFRQPVYAPADGVVIAVQNTIPDQPPGKPNPKHPLGNYVLIRHAKGLFSLCAHLHKGSIRVKPKQRVRTRQPIAKVGNSGASTTPHLHFQLLDRPNLPYAHALPAAFWNLSIGTHSPIPAAPREGQIFFAH